MNINFYLKPNLKSKNQEEPIFCYLRDGSNCKTLYIGQRIQTKYWDKVKKCAKKGYANESLLNSYLHAYKAKVNEIILSELTNNPAASFSALVEAVEAKLKSRGRSSIIDLLDKYIEFLTSNVTPSTVAKYQTLKKLLIRIFGERQVVSMDSLAGKNIVTWFDKITNYLSTVEKQQSNTIRKNIQFIKTFLRWAYERGYADNLDIFLLSKIKLPSETPKTFVTLNHQEIAKVRSAELPPRLDKVRDLFLFQLFTGQRFSDVHNFDISQVDVSEWVWILRQQKGGAKKRTMKVPLIKPVIEIINKHNHNLPKLSNQKMNVYLKEVFNIAGFDDEVIEEKIYLNGNIESIKKKKYELICTHTARRTFATLTIYAGVNTSIIKDYTGHSTDKMLDKYFQSDTNKSKGMIEAVFES